MVFGSQARRTLSRSCPIAADPPNERTGEWSAIDAISARKGPPFGEAVESLVYAIKRTKRVALASARGGGARRHLQHAPHFLHATDTLNTLGT